MWLLIREASAARNLQALLPLVQELGTERIAFCTDDREPEHIAEDGHINSMVRDAVAAGIAPGGRARAGDAEPGDLARPPAPRRDRARATRPTCSLLPDLESFVPETVLKRGRPVGEIERPDVPEWVKHTVRVRHVAARDFTIPWEGGPARVIGVIPDQIVTEGLVEEPLVEDGQAVAGNGLAKIAVVERHLGTGRMAVGLVRGFDLRSGALASTFAHDAHNIVVVGMEDHDMARAIGRLTEIGGGVVVVEDRGVRAELALPVAGLISEAPLDEVVTASRGCIEAAAKLGCTLPSPFQTMSFLALSVIPSLKITDRGLVDVDRFELVPLRA